MSKIREIAWPEEFVELKRIEESMVCGICYEYMDTTVITPCSHNCKLCMNIVPRVFSMNCSLCIRKYLHYKSQCPACFHVFFEKDLYINRAMDVLIQHYVKVREKLISLIENRVVYNTVVEQRETTPSTPSTPPVRPVRNNHFPKSPKVLEIKQSEPKMPVVPSTSSTLTSDASSPTTHKSSKAIPSIAKIFNTPKRKETVVQSVTVAVKSVSCPVCRVDIPENHINVHLDACLKRENGQKAAMEKQKPKRPPLPKLVLRVMKDAELRKKMKEFGLPINGDRRALENRFTRYSTIYNAECDKLDPRPVTDLLRQCEMEEKQERKMDLFLVSSNSAPASNSTSSVRLQIEKDAKEDKIEEAQKTYRLANKSNFDKLIEEVRNRRKMKQSNQSNKDVNVININSSSIDNPNNTENDLIDKDSSSFNPSAEVPFYDSDSDESCPLQHYKSDDPMQFLASNLNNSNSSVSTSGSPMKRSQMPNANFHKNNLIRSKNMSDIYEVSTDESTDDEVQNSPVRNRKLHRKKVKLSKVSPKNSSSTEAQDNTPEMNDSTENNMRQVSARDLCKSIIEDFSFEGMSDDSFSEFSTKPEKSDTSVVGKGQLNESLSKKVRRVPSRNKNTRSSCDVPEEEIQRVILGDFSSNATDDKHDTKTDNVCEKIVNTSTVDSNNVSEKNFCENNESNVELKNTETEKENDILAANEISQSSTNEITIRRPMRKRNRPSRYVENQAGKQDVDVSTLNLSVEDLSENNSPDSCKTVTTSDGSLKRRRGRSKTNTANLATDELHNPPKRPVRRRQAAASRD